MKKMRAILYLIIVSIVCFLFHNCRGSESDEGLASVTYAKINSEGGIEKLLGKTFTFKIKDNLSNDVTSESQIFVDGQLIVGNSYTPTKQGNYAVTAKYKDLPINPISINVVVTSGVSFKHRILYEDFTGTWCGYCTIALARHDNLKNQTNDFVFIGIHGPSGTTDPWSNATSTEMEILKNVSEWPAMYINRSTIWNYDSNYTDMSVPLAQLKAFSKIGIKMSSSISGTMANVTANAFFTENYTNLRMAAFVVEDHLIHDQKNYINTLYGGNSNIINYEHEGVLRNKLSNSVTGDIIPNDQSIISNEYSKSFQYTIPADYNHNNLKIIIMITDQNGTVLNVREEKLNINNNYEFL